MERGYERCVVLSHRAAASFSIGLLVRAASGLAVAIGQFDITVGEFDRAHENFETVGDCSIGRADTR